MTPSVVTQHVSGTHSQPPQYESEVMTGLEEFAPTSPCRSFTSFVSQEAGDEQFEGREGSNEQRAESGPDVRDSGKCMGFKGSAV